MKNVKMILASVIPGSVSVSRFAAMETTMSQGKTLIGRISDSSGSTTLCELNANLAAKAQAAGASSYRIVAMGGNNVLSGTADIYK